LPAHSQSMGFLSEGLWPLCQETGTTDQADHTTPGSGPLNQIMQHSALVWQLTITEHRINKHGAR